MSDQSLTWYGILVRWDFPYSFGSFTVCALAVFSNILKIPQIQILADSDEQEVVQQVQVSGVEYVSFAYCNGICKCFRWRMTFAYVFSFCFCRSSMLIFVPLTHTISLSTYRITTCTCFQQWSILLACRAFVIELLMALLLSSWLSSAALSLDIRGHQMLQKGLHKKLRWVNCHYETLL